MSDLNIISLNVRGVRGNNKRISVLQFLKENKYDIACIQETYFNNNCVDRVKCEWDGTSYHCLTNSAHAKGVSIFLKKGFKGKVLDVHTDNIGRKILLNVEFNNHIIAVANMYAPSEVKERIDFLEKTQTWISQHSNSTSKLIICGDLNTVDNCIDRSSGVIDRSSKQFADLKSNLEVCDIWRYNHPTKSDYTYISTAETGGKSRIDYILVSNDLLSFCKSSTIITAPVPDHRGVLLHLQSENKQRGKGYWKLNVSVLKEKKYIDGIKNLIKHTYEEYNDIENERLKWDLCKIRIKEYSIKYCCTKAMKSRDKIQSIQRELKKIEEIGDEQSKETRKEHQQLTSDLEVLLLEKAIGAQIRSRAEWIETGEKSTKYFLNLETHRQHNNVIGTLKDKSNKVLHKDEEILNECKTFYKHLYQSNQPNTQEINEYLCNIEPRELTEQEKEICEGMITSLECKEALKDMKKGKSPGIDGIPAEFYVTFWDIIEAHILDTYNEAFACQELSCSQNLAVLTLLHKKGDKTNLQNYRPISLLNTDYKILAFVLSRRLHQVLDRLISPDQTGYVKQRKMSHNLRLLLDIIENANNCSKGGVLLCLDFKKAFDSLEWNFMFEILKRHYKFGNTFIQWVHTLYKSPRACVKNNGYISDDFLIERGIRQGCPLSALLFILCVEILAVKIKNNNNIKGYEIYSENHTLAEIKISQYADDSTIILASPDEINETLATVNRFGEISGLKLNLSKTTGLGIGPYKHLNGIINGIIFNKSSIKILGIYMGNNTDECTKLNWEDKITELERLLQKWKCRDLTFFGKITIIKCLGLSKFTFLATNCPMPGGIKSKIEKILYKFLWNGTEKIKRTTLCRPYTKGGLNMVDIATYFDALKAAWLPSILETNDAHWNLIAKSYILKFDKQSILNFAFDKGNFLQLNSLPKFYQDIIKAYARSEVNDEPKSTCDILQQPLWGNEYIYCLDKHGKKVVLYFQNWATSGIHFVKDIKIDNNKIDEFYLYTKVKNKQNIYVEITKMCKALKKYTSKIHSNKPTKEAKDQKEKVKKGSKIIYNTTMSKYKRIPTSELKWQEDLKCELDFSIAYTNKVIKIKEKKLAEFNFKVLHRILSCKSNLYKWKIEDNDICDICSEKQDIMHLLLNCRRAQPVWKMLGDNLNININEVALIIGHVNCKYNFLITLISYLLYKEWIVISRRDNRNRAASNLIIFLKSELHRRKNIYLFIGWYDYVEAINIVLDIL